MIRDSYWLDMPYAPSDPLSGDLDVDVVVIGGRRGRSPSRTTISWPVS